MSARRSFTLMVRNLPWTVGNEQLKEHFSQFGNVRSAQVLFNMKTGFSQGYGFVSYSNPNDAEKAYKKSNQFLDGQNIDIDYSNKQRNNI